MKPGEDPRPDQHKDREGGGYQDTGTSDPSAAPGGVGTTQQPPAPPTPPPPPPQAPGGGETKK